MISILIRYMVDCAVVYKLGPNLTIGYLTIEFIELPSDLALKAEFEKFINNTEFLGISSKYS